MQGRTVLITGATAGSGYETARLLARRGADLIITGRAREGQRRRVATIQRESAVGSVDFIRADHSTVASRRRQRVVSQLASGLPVSSSVLRPLRTIIQPVPETLSAVLGAPSSRSWVTVRRQ
jgi:NAD(P)-dependent dehydrogenase (short-subunit alcohol dehydrogenase family)